MPKSCIPGYDEALERERQIREDGWIGGDANICGIKIQQITPFLFARLCRMKTPYVGRGFITPDETVRFLWALSPSFVGERRSYPRSNFWRKLLGLPMLGPYATRDAFIRDAFLHLYGRWHEAEREILDFLSDTFMDSPHRSGSECVPYVIGAAWMVYRMGCEPFRWSKDQTLHTPMRIIYQLMKCQDMDRGKILYNPSDRLKAEYLDSLNAQKVEGRN